MITKILPAYLYQQYNGDEDLTAFFTAYNVLAQQYLDDTNNLNLPIYTQPTGILLDWVALGIYGIVRPSLSTPAVSSPLGVYDTVPYDTTAYSEDIKTSPSSFYAVTDDYFKRIMTWNFYKGDGFQYTTAWLKRRIRRFLEGVNGVDFPIDNTYDISVTYTAPNTINIVIPNTTVAPIFESAIQGGVLNVPFQYIYNITY